MIDQLLWDRVCPKCSLRITPSEVEAHICKESDVKYKQSYTIEDMLGQSLESLSKMTDEEFEKYISPCLTACPTPAPLLNNPAVKKNNTLTPASSLGRSLVSSSKPSGKQTMAQKLEEMRLIQEQQNTLFKL